MNPPKALPRTGYVPTWDDSGQKFRERMQQYAMRAASTKAKRGNVQNLKPATHATGAK